jgi:hypothetical protein
MTIQITYQRLLETSQRVNWRVEDVISDERALDFSLPFLPESFARVRELGFLTPDEQRTLNHIRGYGYLSMFELVERCILPYIDAHTPSSAGQDAARTPAMAQFAQEEEKHIQLFTRFRSAFIEGFGTDCGFIGPAEQIGAAIRNHSALGMAIFVLGIEWATQQHYLESVRDDQSLDPQFRSLLKHHWLEESQHAKLDALLFRELASTASKAQIAQAIDDFLDIGGFIDGGLAQQVALDFISLETAIGRTLSEPDRATFARAQLQAMRWTFLGSAMVNRGFLDALDAVTPEGRRRIEQISPVFC